MTKFLKLRLIVLCCLLAFISSCSQVPITGRSQFNLVPDSMMDSMAVQSYDEFLKQNKLSTNAKDTAMVKRCGERISKAVEAYCNANGIGDRVADYHWEFNLVQDPNVNAWCMPGGKVVVYTGLLPIAAGEDGLAVVLGHEIAHAVAKHGAERMTQGLIVQMGGMALSEAVSKYPAQTQSLFLQSYNAGTNVGFLLPYSRVHESEADHMGLIFMAMAGYDPHVAIDFWQRMAANSQGKKPPELLSTHPADETRIANIKRLIPEAMTYYKPVQPTQ